MNEERLQNTINEMLERANKALLDTDWEAVKKSSETVLGLDEGNEEAKKLLGLAENNLSGSQFDITRSTSFQAEKETPKNTSKKQPNHPIKSSSPIIDKILKLLQKLHVKLAGSPFTPLNKSKKIVLSVAITFYIIGIFGASIAEAFIAPAAVLFIGSFVLGPKKDKRFKSGYRDVSQKGNVWNRHTETADFMMAIAMYCAILWLIASLLGLNNIDFSNHINM